MKIQSFQGFGLSVLFALALTAYAAGNLVANPSAETANAAQTAPVSWTTNAWGTNSPVFEYVNDGYLSSKAMKVTLNSRTSGDAKWYFEPIAVSPNTTYSFSEYYKANIPSHIVLMTQNAAGTATYTDLAVTAAASTDWKHFSTTFKTSSTAAKVSVFHVIERAGTLTTDDFSLTLGTTTSPVPPTPTTTPTTPTTTPTTPTTPTTTPSGSLFANPSVETANGNSPQSWSSNKWGTTQATFTYPSTGGHSGSRYVKTQVTQAGTGDAKWYPNAVTATAGQTLLFSDWYQSDAQSTVEAEVLLTNGSYQYLTLGTLAPSATWKQFQKNFTLPANARTVTILHFIQAVGSLSVDEYILSSGTTTPTPPASGLVQNASLETPGSPATLPQGWHKEQWGSNTPVYEYLTNEGHTGTHSVKVSMTNYVDGDAKWYFDPLILAPGDYRFTAWYKTNTIPHAVVRYLMPDGSEQFLGLPDPQPSGTGWQKYSDIFSVPADAVNVTVFFYLANNGYVQTDDYSVEPATYSKFNRGLVTLTFDDGFEKNAQMVLPVLNQYGFKTTQCYATQYIQGLLAQEANVKLFANGGHEICSHTITHPDLTTLASAPLTQELQQSQSYLKTLTGQAVKSFSSPFGAYNAGVNVEVAKYYQAHRTTDEGFNARENWNPLALRVQNMQASTTLAQVEQWVTKAKADKTWLILLYHRIDTENIGQFDTYKADFDVQMAWLASSGVTVKRMDDALAELKPQI